MFIFTASEATLRKSSEDEPSWVANGCRSWHGVEEYTLWDEAWGAFPSRRRILSTHLWICQSNSEIGPSPPVVPAALLRAPPTAPLVVSPTPFGAPPPSVVPPARLGTSPASLIVPPASLCATLSAPSVFVPALPWCSFSWSFCYSSCSPWCFSSCSFCCSSCSPSVLLLLLLLLFLLLVLVLLLVLDKMVRTKWCNFIFCVHFNFFEFNIYI